MQPFSISVPQGIGDTFFDELKTAGVPLDGIAWGGNSVTCAGSTADAVREKIETVIRNHVPFERPPVVEIAVIDLYRRMTDGEFAAMEAGVATQSKRLQGIFARADNFRSDAPEWELLKAMAVQLYGPTRAAELLTP